jgi:hypothetical protein
MSDVAAAKIVCDGCGKSYAWKAELAGKKVKCKCGTVIHVPQPTAPKEEPDDLYDLAPSEETVKPKKRLPLAPAAATATTTVHSSSAALAYEAGPTQRQKDRMSRETLMDMNRDVYVPIGLLIAGILLYVGYYAMRYHLTAYGVGVISFGLIVLTAFKAALLVGFAMAVANPLGVSFGGIGTATLKLAAIAVFCDGITTWVDAFVIKISGGTFGGGIFGYGVMSFPVALGAYWVLLIYLFSMDSGDSWTVVMVLSVFDRIVKMALAFTVLAMVLRMGGVSVPGIGGGGGGKMSSVSELTTHVEELQERKLLKEAKAYINDGHQMFLGPTTDAWYKAGAKTVWFEVSRDFSGKTEPEQVIIEMPEDKNQRVEILNIRQKFYQQQKWFTDPSDLTDDGEMYISARIR